MANGMVLLYKCSTEPWINGLRNIPLHPFKVLGYTQNSLKLVCNCSSNQKTAHIKMTPTKGATTTELVNLKYLLSDIPSK